MTNKRERIFTLGNETFMYLSAAQRQILFAKVEVLDHKIKGLLTVHLQQIRSRQDYIEKSVLSALSAHFPTLINELYEQEVKEMA